MKKIKLLIILSLPLFIYSCKQCYDCQQYEYCMDCVASTTNGPIYFNDCYASDSKRDSAFQAIQAGQGGANISCEFKENQLDAQEEVCNTKKKIDGDLDAKKDEGFTCVAQ